MKATIHIAGTSIEVEAESQVKLVEKMGFWSQVPGKCGNCDSNNIGFFSRNPSGNLYVGMKCRECGYELNFGQHKEGGKLFVKHDGEWQAPWKPGDGGGGYEPRGNSSPAVDHDEDSIPF